MMIASGAVIGWFAHRACSNSAPLNGQCGNSRLTSVQEIDSALRRARVLRFEGHRPDIF
jgi:hypothetical protein